MKQDVFQDKRYNSNYRLLGDVRLSNICMTTDEVEDYKKWIGEKLSSNRMRSDVILTTTPQQVSLSMIFDLSDLNKLRYRICSTMEGALEFLDIDISNIEIIENEIERMIVK